MYELYKQNEEERHKNDDIKIKAEQTAENEIGVTSGRNYQRLAASYTEN